MTARVLMASKTDVLSRRVTVPTVEKPFATQVLNHLSSAVKSIFRDDTPLVASTSRGSGIFTKILLIGAGKYNLPMRFLEKSEPITGKLENFNFAIEENLRVLKLH